MRYLIITTDKTSFFTAWYQYENHWNDKLFAVIDTNTDRITFDGKTWQEIQEDSL